MYLPFGGCLVRVVLPDELKRERKSTHSRPSKGYSGAFSLCRSVDHAPATNREWEEQATRGKRREGSGQIRTQLPMIPWKSCLSVLLHLESFGHIFRSATYRSLPSSPLSLLFPATTHKASTVSVLGPRSTCLLNKREAAVAPPVEPRRPYFGSCSS